MSYLYIMENGASMGIDGGCFKVRYKDNCLHSIPKETLESVALFGNVNITVQCVQELLERGIPVSYFSSKGRYFGRLDSTAHKDISRLKSQIYLSDDEDFSLRLGRCIINAKLNNQLVVLRRYDRGSECTECYIQMREMRRKANGAVAIEELMGYEGTGAKAYFKGLSQLIVPDFAFAGRNRMPPRDPFNSLISLGYTLLLYEIYGEIENKGLSPYCGFIHADRERHPTLASDLMEEWRAVIVDSVALSLIQGHEIHPEHFTRDEETGGVYLTSEGMRIFLKKYEEKLRSSVSYIEGKRMSVRKCLWYQVNALVNAIESRDPDRYSPIFIR